METNAIKEAIVYQPLRVFWNLVAIGGATAVGVTTRDAGLTAITFLGGLVVPRLLGLAPRRHGPFGWAQAGCAGRQAGGYRRAERFEAWHREAHGDAPAPTQTAPGPAQS